MTDKQQPKPTDQQPQTKLQQRANRDCMDHKKSPAQPLQILTCLVCLKKAVNAHMCPYCSKLACEICFKDWLESRKGECPSSSCRRQLRVDKLVNCTNFAREIQEMLAKKEQQEELCRKHKTKIQYYCKNCRIAVCSQCALFQPDHKGHDFDKLTTILARFEQQHRSTLSTLQSKRKSLTSMLEQIERTVFLLRELKEEKNAELERFTNGVCERIQRGFVSAVGELEGEEGVLQGQWEALRRVYEEFNSKLVNYSKPKLILEYPTLLDNLSEIPTLLLQPIPQIPTFSLPNQLTPEYSSQKYLIKNYTALRKQKQVFYTQPFTCKNLSWRLKIYPNGSQSSQDTYLSIFVQLFKLKQLHTTKNPHNPLIGKYKYRVDILNQLNNSKFSREFESEFELGECWGYNTYAKITMLYEEGFVHPVGDHLEVVLNVKAPTYYHQVADLERVLIDKKGRYEENLKRLGQLKERLGLGTVGTDKSNPELQMITVERESQSGDVISLDEIREVSNGEMGVDESPRVEDQEIFGAVLSGPAGQNVQVGSVTTISRPSRSSRQTIDAAK